MDPIKIIQKYYKEDSKAHTLLVTHSIKVKEKALEIAKNIPELNPDLKFIEEAAMLHDIGIFLTNTPHIGCFGNKPYICHTYLGRELLEKEGFPKHALVCERHLGVGVKSEEIERRNLPLPKREMMPISIEEEIISFADNFFTKTEEFVTKEKTLDEIKKNLARFGEDKVQQFNEWLIKFKY